MKNGCKLYTIPHCKIMYTNDIIYSSVFGRFARSKLMDD